MYDDTTNQERKTTVVCQAFVQGDHTPATESTNVLKCRPAPINARSNAKTARWNSLL